MNVNINSPIESNRSKGMPRSVASGNALDARQLKLLKHLPEFESRIVVKKRDVSMRDLAALTAYTGVEFALFTRNNERLIIRGDIEHVEIDDIDATMLNQEGYRWSGHTHVGASNIDLVPSDGDFRILACFLQDYSAIYNSVGDNAKFKKVVKYGRDNAKSN